MMKIGDLVTVKPARGGLYFITNLNASEGFGPYLLPLPDCVMVTDIETGMELPMDKKWVEIISKVS